MWTSWTQHYNESSKRWGRVNYGRCLPTETTVKEESTNTHLPYSMLVNRPYKCGARWQHITWTKETHDHHLCQRNACNSSLCRRPAKTWSLDVNPLSTNFLEQCNHFCIRLQPSYHLCLFSHNLQSETCNTWLSLRAWQSRETWYLCLTWTVLPPERWSNRQHLSRWKSLHR